MKIAGIFYIKDIGVMPDRRDMSMAFKTTLTKEEYKKHYEEIVDKIKRFAINDFNYDVPRVTEYKFDFMIDLLNELSLQTSLNLLLVYTKARSHRTSCMA
jgi:hypothetical protein